MKRKPSLNAIFFQTKMFTSDHSQQQDHYTWQRNSHFLPLFPTGQFSEVLRHRWQGSFRQWGSAALIFRQMIKQLGIYPTLFSGANRKCGIGPSGIQLLLQTCQRNQVCCTKLVLGFDPCAEQETLVRFSRGWRTLHCPLLYSAALTPVPAWVPYHYRTLTEPQRIPSLSDNFLTMVQTSNSLARIGHNFICLVPAVKMMINRLPLFFVSVCKLCFFCILRKECLYIFAD